MTSIPDSCRHPGCSRPRSRHSIFCDEHHDDSLRRVGIEPYKRVPRDPCAELSRYCESVLRNHRLEVITTTEASGQIRDLLIQAHGWGESHCWSECLEKLPPVILRGVLEDLKRDPGPRTFFRSSEPAARREAKTRALAGQKILRDELLRRISARG